MDQLKAYAGNGVELWTTLRLMLVMELSCEPRGGLSHLPPKFEHIFVAVITFPPFLLCRYF